MSGIAAATLDRVLGDIDGFQFGFVHIGSKLRLARSEKWLTEPASVHLADWPSALPLPGVSLRILHFDGAYCDAEFVFVCFVIFLGG